MVHFHLQIIDKLYKRFSKSIISPLFKFSFQVSKYFVKKSLTCGVMWKFFRRIWFNILRHSNHSSPSLQKKKKNTSKSMFTFQIKETFQLTIMKEVCNWENVSLHKVNSSFVFLDLVIEKPRFWYDMLRVFSFICKYFSHVTGIADKDAFNRSELFTKNRSKLFMSIIDKFVKFLCTSI